MEGGGGQGVGLMFEDEEDDDDIDIQNIMFAMAIFFIIYSSRSVGQIYTYIHIIPPIQIQTRFTIHLQTDPEFSFILC